MESHRRATGLLSNQSPETRRRLILFPLPFQGHINPMLQLAIILHTNRFKITIIHTEYNALNTSNYPHFTFNSFSDGFSKIVSKNLASSNVGFYLTCLNESCVGPFWDCLSGLLSESGEDPVAGLITDAGFYFTQAVAACHLVYDQEYDAPVPEFPLLKVKDIVKITSKPQSMGNLVTNMVKEMKAASGIIWNTFKELEEPELETIYQQFPVLSFTIGPFHKYFGASSSSLLEQDQTIISWLDIQVPKSVIYLSFGSVARITESEFQEVAHGLAIAGSPFLWVVRPGVVHGSEWLELLPVKFLEDVGNRGRIVK